MIRSTFRFLVVLMVVIAALCGTATAQVSWILESAEGTVRFSNGKDAATEVTVPPQLALKRGDVLLLEPGAKVVVFDGRKRAEHSQASDATGALTVRVPAAVTRGNVLERIMAGAAERRRQSVPGGVLVRVGVAKPEAKITWPPRDGSFKGSQLPAVLGTVKNTEGLAVKVEVIQLAAISATEGKVVETFDLPAAEESVRWTPKKKSFSKGTYFMIRLSVDGEAYDSRVVWKADAARKDMEKQLKAEFELKSSKALKASPIYPYFLEELEAAKLGDPPKD